MPQRVVVNSNAEAKTASQSEVGGCVSSVVIQGLCAERAAIWFDCRAYERAESQYYLRLQERQNGTTSAASTNSQRSRESSLTKPVFDRSLKHPESVIAPRSLQLLPASPLYDEGYLSQTPTPPTPASAPINGLPFVPAFLQGVWFQKSLYDRAEAAFYQNLYRVNEPLNDSTPDENQTSLGHPRTKAKSDKAKEKKSGDNGAKKASSELCHFLHADSERVWLERHQYFEAESRFYQAVLNKTNCSPSPKMSAVECLSQDRIWFDKPRYDEAERKFYERMNGPTLPPQTQDSGANTILQDIARARENIQKSLAGLKTTLQPTTDSAHKSPTPPQSLTTAGGSSAEHGEILTRMKKLELENQSLQKIVAELRSALSNLESRVSDLEKRPAAPAAVVNGFASSKTALPPPTQKTPPAPADDDDDADDDDIDLFGSDDEVDEEAERLKEQRLQEYAAKKAKKPAIIAKSSILLDVKPWDDETDMAKMEECVRSIQVDGLLWGASKLVPVGYGIKKLQINCVVEDDKVGTDLLEEEITKFEDYVQSVDVAAFNKI